MLANDLRTRIERTLQQQRGVLFSEPAIVHRGLYSGRDVIAPNSRFTAEYTDSRGYVPVEWWIMSTTAAENEIPKAHEGITQVHLADGEKVLLTEAVASAGDLLFGAHEHSWPLTKILDIGGAWVTPSFGGPPEVPPIPVHTHAGPVIEGRVRPPGKLEAYFFPPVDVPPYNMDLSGVVTRLGLRAGVDRRQVLEALCEFGHSDAMYELCRVFPVRPYDGWTIRPGTLHAPGPWPTFEIQYPQDDLNLLSWRLGARPGQVERDRLWRSLALRGLRDEADILAQTVDWQRSTDPDFKTHHFRPSRTLDEGSWGRRLQIFFDEFYGEALEVNPGHTYTCEEAQQPFAGIVWSGSGRLGELPIAAPRRRGERPEHPQEFLVTPGRPARFASDEGEILRVYTLFPLRESGV